MPALTCSHHFFVHGRGFFRRQHALFGETRFEQRDRIALLPVDHFVVGAVGEAHAADADVVVEAVGLALEQRRARPFARSFDRFAGRLVHGHRVHAVDDDAGHAVTGRAVGDVDDRLVVGLRRVFAVAVVLADQDRRQLVERGHVRRFVEGAFVDRAVAEERNGDVFGLPELLRERGADRDRRTAADDAVCAEHAELHVADVHAAAFAFAVAGGAAVELREHAVELAAFGDQVAVAAMRAGDLIVVRQMHHHAGGDRFLTDV